MFQRNAYKTCILVALCITISCPASQKSHPPQSSGQDNQDNPVTGIPRLQQYCSVLFPLSCSHQNMNRSWISYSISLGDRLTSRLLSPGRRKKKKKKAAAEETLQNSG